MFADEKLKQVALVVLQWRGSLSLIGGAIKAELSREELTRVLTDGFFPRSDIGELPKTARRTGLAQMALPYAQDAGVTRHHWQAFLTRQAQAMMAAHDAPLDVAGRKIRASDRGAFQRRCF